MVQGLQLVLVKTFTVEVGNQHRHRRAPIAWTRPNRNAAACVWRLPRERSGDWIKLFCHWRPVARHRSRASAHLPSAA